MFDSTAPFLFFLFFLFLYLRYTIQLYYACCISFVWIHLNLFLWSINLFVHFQDILPQYAFLAILFRNVNQLLEQLFYVLSCFCRHLHAFNVLLFASLLHLLLLRKPTYHIIYLFFKSVLFPAKRQNALSSLCSLYISHHLKAFSADTWLATS